MKNCLIIQRVQLKTSTSNIIRTSNKYINIFQQHFHQYIGYMSCSPKTSRFNDTMS